MTTTRQIAAWIATTTGALADLVILGLELDFDDCEICGQPSAERFTRLTEGGERVEACETCVDHHHLAYAAD